MKAGSARVHIMEMEPGRWEVTPEEEVRGWLGEVSDGDGEQWWSEWAGAAEDVLSHCSSLVPVSQRWAAKQHGTFLEQLARPPGAMFYCLLAAPQVPEVPLSCGWRPQAEAGLYV